MNKGMKLNHRENWISKKQLLEKVKKLELENQYLRKRVKNKVTLPLLW